ncbi:MAG: hypothetical protein FJX76_07265 [Armatimonadetes bacterium]|nr:hypothetical protein [Armatimonadota bacterium]
MNLITSLGYGPARKTGAEYGAKTAEKLKAEFGDEAILSAKDPRVAVAREAAKHMGNGLSASDLGSNWEERMSMLPGHTIFELSSHGPRATRQVLTVDGESQQITLMATYPEGRNRVVETIRIFRDAVASLDRKSSVDHEG